jgi:hypothetical protein
VARWQLLAGPSKAALQAVGEAKANGFETTVQASTGESMVAVRALDADGKTLGTSAPVRPKSR